MNECDFVSLKISYFARYATTIGLIILGVFVEFYVGPNSSDDCSTPAAQYRKPIEQIIETMPVTVESHSTALGHLAATHPALRQPTPGGRFGGTNGKLCRRGNMCRGETQIFLKRAAAADGAIWSLSVVYQRLELVVTLVTCVFIDRHDFT